MYHVAYWIYHMHRVPTRTTYRARWNLDRCWRASDGLLCCRHSSAGDVLRLRLRSWLSCRTRRKAIIITLIRTRTVFVACVEGKSPSKSDLYKNITRTTRNEKPPTAKTTATTVTAVRSFIDAYPTRMAEPPSIKFIERTSGPGRLPTRAQCKLSYTTHTMIAHARAFDPLQWAYNTFTLPLINTFFFFFFYFLLKIIK